MVRRIIRAVVVPVALIHIVAGEGAAQTAEQIVKRSEDLLKGVSSKGRFRMTIVTPDYTRSMEMRAWWVGNQKALIEITSPRREAGNKTLKVNNELWMYLRNTETTIKIPPSMMLQSWNGSDFTNDDLVRESSLVEDYTMRIAAEETVDGELCWKIELLPKPTAPVVWGRIFHWIRKKDLLPARTEYFDEKGALMRTMLYQNVKRFGNRAVPSNWLMVNNTKPNHSTEFQYLEAQFDIPLSDRIFSFQELEKGRNR
ncbi:MAG: outer membrane lipoprotein-sorting protein [Ignavibacteria bacterium]|nr:outer membrane lipoprotein-sorting protein [Ignavibacteria bacterium]